MSVEGDNSQTKRGIFQYVSRVHTNFHAQKSARRATVTTNSFPTKPLHPRCDIFHNPSPPQLSYKRSFRENRVTEIGPYGRGNLIHPPKNFRHFPIPLKQGDESDFFENRRRATEHVLVKSLNRARHPPVSGGRIRLFCLKSLIHPPVLVGWKCLKFLVG